jgi:hypothetical protein
VVHKKGIVFRNLMRQKIVLTSVFILFAAFLFFNNAIPVAADPLDQQPTGSIATVTSTPTGPLATVRFGMEEQVNVRSGPNVLYDKIGVLLPGQKVPALGKSAGGGWILIQYMGVPGNVGWVWSNYVDLTPGELPVVEPPPQPTTIVTQTIDPTLAAQFVVTPLPTRLPTFTPAPTLIATEFKDASGVRSLAGIPMGLVILILAALGVLIAVVSYFQNR